MKISAGQFILWMILLAAPAYADVVVITFDGLPGTGDIFVPSYTEDGFTFSGGLRISRPNNGATYLENNSNHITQPHTIRIEMGGATFDFLSAETVFATTGTSLFRGSNGVVVDYFAVNGNFGDLFRNVTWIEWVRTGTSGDFGPNPHGLDNFTFNVNPNAAPVPEPATLLLLGSGLLGVVTAAKKRRGT